MNTKYLSKQRLIAVNDQAAKAGGNHVDPAFLLNIPDGFMYPVCRALLFPMERGRLRCWVTVGADDLIVEENIHHVLIDMPGEVFEKLPTIGYESATDSRRNNDETE